MVIHPIVLALIALASGGLVAGKSLKSIRMAASTTPQASAKDPYRSPAEVPPPPPAPPIEKPTKTKEKKMSTPLTKKQTFAVQTFLLSVLIAFAVLTYGILFPILNDGLRVAGPVAIVSLLVGGMVAISYYND